MYAKKNKQLPEPRRKYYVGEPVIVLPLADYERLANHMTDVALMGHKSQNEQAGVKEKHSLLLKKVRADIKAAKAYYHIKAAVDVEGSVNA